jgi:hypothetical protein
MFLGKQNIFFVFLLLKFIFFLRYFYVLNIYFARLNSNPMSFDEGKKKHILFKLDNNSRIVRDIKKVPAN